MATRRGPAAQPDGETTMTELILERRALAAQALPAVALRRLVGFAVVGGGAVVLLAQLARLLAGG
jgi:hypothetical protein